MSYQIMFVLFNSNITGVNIGAGTDNGFRSSAFSPTWGGGGGYVAQSLIFCVAIC